LLLLNRPCVCPDRHETWADAIAASSIPFLIIGAHYYWLARIAHRFRTNPLAAALILFGTALIASGVTFLFWSAAHAQHGDMGTGLILGGAVVVEWLVASAMPRLARPLVGYRFNPNG
jgi:hypothetical protein